MSAIAGIFFSGGRDVTDSDLQRLVAATPRIGPEGSGSWRSGSVGMVRFRHSTTPEAVNEVQPHRDPRSDSVICFDGRLDNRAELLSTLRGSLPAAAPDCVIALALYEEVGDGFLKHLVGDYALAIWSSRARRLFCARSPLGWRPFLWTFDGKRFAFASQPRTLIEGVGMDRRLNEGAIGEYLSGRFVTLTDTFWQGLQRLPGGSALTVEDGRLRTWHWHDGPFEDLSRLPEADHVERFLSLFDQALVASMRSTTPVVSQLSGGLDSSSIVCRATQLHRAARIDRQVEAITIRYPGEVQDETEWSSAVERHLGIEAMVASPKSMDWNELRSWCAETLHLPIRPNVLKTVSERLRADGKRVLLTGEGGDDWLGGSHGHWPDLLLQGRWMQILREGLPKGLITTFKGRIKAMAVESAGPVLSSYLRERALRPHLDFRYDAPDWIEPEWAKRIELSARWRTDVLPVDLPTFAQRQRYQVYILGRRHVNYDNVGAYADSQGVEVRHPFHDLRLTQFLMGAAGHMLLRNEQKKYLLREAMRGTLPEKVRTRRTKANFTPTLIDSVSERFRERGPEELLPVKMGWVKGANLANAHAEHRAWREAKGRNPLPNSFYSQVWFAVAIDFWLEHALGIER